jgi:hypothetical protein
VILAVIVACEIGFWAAIIGGLAARYLLAARTLGAALLVCAPLIDVVLLVAVAAHLSTGATTSWHHGLAALYIGFSVAYGHRMIAWADTRFAHRFAGGPVPVKPAGRHHTRQCWADVLRTLAAALIATGIIAAITWWVGDPARTAALSGWHGTLGIIVAIEFIRALSYTIWPRKSVEPLVRGEGSDGPPRQPTAAG